MIFLIFGHYPQGKALTLHLSLLTYALLLLHGKQLKAPLQGVLLDGITSLYYMAL